MIPLLASALLLALCALILARAFAANWAKVRKAGPWRWWFPE